MIVSWKCPTCSGSNHLQVRNKLVLTAEQPDEFTDEVICEECGNIYYLHLSMEAEIQKHELGVQA
jgi:uncharacterized Zn finger protein